MRDLACLVWGGNTFPFGGNFPLWGKSATSKGKSASNKGTFSLWGDFSLLGELSPLGKLSSFGRKVPFGGTLVSPLDPLGFLGGTAFPFWLLLGETFSGENSSNFGGTCSQWETKTKASFFLSFFHLFFTTRGRGKLVHPTTRLVLLVCECLEKFLNKSSERELNLSGSWHRGHSHAYNTPF